MYVFVSFLPPTANTTCLVPCIPLLYCFILHSLFSTLLLCCLGPLRGLPPLPSDYTHASLLPQENAQGLPRTLPQSHYPPECSRLQATAQLRCIDRVIARRRSAEHFLRKHRHRQSPRGQVKHRQHRHRTSVGSR